VRWILRLRGIADAKNLNVIVFVIYDGAASHEQDASLPPDSQTWKAMEADDGAATVPASVLATFPINARLRIGVMRGIFESMASNGRNYTLYAITRADGAFKLMP